MDVGVGGYRTFRYVPEFNGNRALPEAEQVSVEVVRPSTAQRLAQQGPTPAALHAWRDQALAPWLADAELAEAVPQLGVEVLLLMRTVAQHTRDWRGLTLDGRALTDPLEVCLRAPLPLAGERALIREVYDVIQEAGDLTGVALGNFARQCAGSCSGTTPAPMAGGTAADAAAPETAGPATTPEGPSA